MLTLYHHTSNSAAAAIMRDRAMRSAAPIDMGPSAPRAGCVEHPGAEALESFVTIGVARRDARSDARLLGRDERGDAVALVGLEVAVGGEQDARRKRGVGRVQVGEEQLRAPGDVLPDACLLQSEIGTRRHFLDFEHRLARRLHFF